MIWCHGLGVTLARMVPLNCLLLKTSSLGRFAHPKKYCNFHVAVFGGCVQVKDLSMYVIRFHFPSVNCNDMPPFHKNLWAMGGLLGFRHWGTKSKISVGSPHTPVTHHNQLLHNLKCQVSLPLILKASVSAHENNVRCHSESACRMVQSCISSVTPPPPPHGPCSRVRRKASCMLPSL